MSFRPIALAALGLFAALLGSGPTSASSFVQIKAGEILSASLPTSSGVQPGQAIGVVNAPAALVEKILDGFEHYKDFVPSCTGSRQVKPGAYVLEGKLPRPVNHAWAYVEVNAQRERGAHLVRWTMVKGSVKRYEGKAWVRPLDRAHCVLTYQLLIVPHTMTPDRLVSSALRKAAATMVQAVRERATAVGRDYLRTHS